LDKSNIAGKNAVNAMADGDMQRMMLMGVKRFTKQLLSIQKMLAEELSSFNRRKSIRILEGSEV